MSESIATRSPLAALGLTHSKMARKTRRAHRNYRDAIEREGVRAATGDPTQDPVSAEARGCIWQKRRERQFGLLRLIADTPATALAEISTKTQALVTAQFGVADNHASAQTLLALAEGIAADLRRLIEAGTPAG